MSENDILKIEFLKVNGFNVKLKVNVYGNVKAYGILHQYIYLYVYEIGMHMLKYHESFKMCKECICVLMIK